MGKREGKKERGKENEDIEDKKQRKEGREGRRENVILMGQSEGR